MRRFLTPLFTLFTLIATSQTSNESAIEYPIRQASRLYSANFGEIRSGHFHTGIDLKTDGIEGREAVAVEDGFVSRVVVSASGYGLAIYLTLDNGMTAVYGHMLRFREDIQEYVDAKRKADRTNNVNLYFNSKTWPVKRGDLIGYAGDSGSSGGPHLHFELRDTPTQSLYNVVKEGYIRPKDSIAPLIMQLHYIEVDTLQGIPHHATKRTYTPRKLGEGRYALHTDGAIEVGRNGYFVLEATDRRDGVWNSFGVWRVRATIDAECFFEYQMNTLTFPLSRHSNAISHYAIKRESRNEVLRLAHLQGAPTDLYTTMKNRGVISVEVGKRHTITIEVEDDSDNLSTLQFDIVGSQNSFKATVPDGAQRIYADKRTHLNIDGGRAQATISQGALYESIIATPQRVKSTPIDTSLVILSPAYRFLEQGVPLKGAIDISIFIDSLPAEMHSKARVARYNEKDGKLSYVGGKYSDSQISVSTKTTGALMIVADTIAPTITPLFNSNTEIARLGEIQFGVKDNFSGIASWQLFVDGEFTPSYHYPSKRRIRYPIAKSTTKRERTVELIATDLCGNKTTYTTRAIY